MKFLLSKVRSPFFVLPILFLLITFGWKSYLNYDQNMHYDTMSNNSNILPNPGFEKWSNSGNENHISNWNVTSASSKNKFRTEMVKGNIKGNALRLDIDNYQDKSVVISSEKIDVEPNQTYFFKSFYATDCQFELTVELTDKNGNINNVFLREYPDYDYPWSTMSSAFSTNSDTTKISIKISLTSSGYIELDEAYMISQVNRIKDAEKEKQLPDILQGKNWEFMPQSGITALPIEKDGIRSINVSEYQIGSVAWKPEAVDVQPDDLIKLLVNYESDQVVDFGIDYRFADGRSFYKPYEIFQPNSQATSRSIEIEVPANVVSMQPSLQISKIGMLSIRDFKAYKIKSSTKFSEPRLSITFDDGIISSYLNGAKTLDANDMKGTFYINPEFLSTPSYMSEGDVLDLLKRKHQIGSHTNTHIDVTSFDEKKIKSELDKANKKISQLNVKNIDFASPYGKYDSKSLDIIRKNQSSHRGTDGGINTKQNYDKFQIKALFIRKDVSDEVIKEYLEQAKQTNGWFVLIYHGIEPSESMFAIDQAKFEKQIKIIKDSGIKVDTVQNCIDFFDKQI